MPIPDTIDRTETKLGKLTETERRDELLDAELDAVHGGLVVNAIIAILISPLLPSPSTKAMSN
jgi:hypothetical protein